MVSRFHAVVSDFQDRQTQKLGADKPYSEVLDYPSTAELWYLASQKQ